MKKHYTINDLKREKYKVKTKQQLKLLFLDVDGVLNCSNTKDRINNHIGIEDEKVSLLKKIICKTNANIILISSWKLNWFYDEKEKLNQDDLANYLDEKMNEYGLSIEDKTEGNSFYRGAEIIEYLRMLKKCGFGFKKFVIIDDGIFDYKETKLKKHLVQTDYKIGLTSNDVIKAIKRL